MKRLLCAALLSIFAHFTFSQEIQVSNDYPQGDFRPPLDIPPSLSGSFGELRGNHFHSGLDYRTNQREGYPVYAAADGYVSRLRVQVGGFGNAVYLNHYNGYTTVYAHLQKFNETITRTVKNYQYTKQSFGVDFPLLHVEIPVKKGDIIAWSGNSGSSGGPHLHFEIRDTQTEEIINPQLFGLAVPDRVPPIINGLYMYRLGGTPFSENTPKQYFQVISTSPGNYRLNNNPLINVSGEFGFGIITSDQNVVSGNLNGVYSIELLIDEIPVYAAVLERFHFHHSRAINSHVDYPSMLGSGRRIQKSFVEPGNPLTIYKTLVNNGTISLQDDQVHDAKYVVKDVAGNTSTLSFRIRQNDMAVIPAKHIESESSFLYNQQNDFEAEGLKVLIPQGALYSDMNFKYATTKGSQRAFSPVHHIHARTTPLHIPFSLEIRADSSLKEPLHSKALIVDTRGVNHGGTFDNGWVKTSARSFGNFYITTDTTAPVIRSINVADGKSFKDIARMIFKISDNLSGIKEFTGTIDGQWVLMEYDPKTATLWHTFDEMTLPGKHLFQLIVTDMKDNTKTYSATIYR